MALPISPPTSYASLARDTIPAGKEWQYEPKWDGFRCPAFKDGQKVELQSKSRQSGPAVDSLLVGLYDDGLLHHVGFTSTFSQQEKLNLLQIVEPLIEPPGFTGNAPGGPRRWSTDHSAEWQRWRPDKSPEACAIDQVKPAFWH